MCSTDGSPFGAGHYGALDNLPAAAVRVSLGCGNPTAVAELHPGDTVLDLGSGGGLDVLLSARRVGPSGFVYGIDATPEMIELARRNADEAGVGNVRFLHGTIEHIPLDDASVDAVISNCVIVLPSTRTVCSTRSPGPARRRTRRHQRHHPPRRRRWQPGSRRLRHSAVTRADYE